MVMAVDPRMNTIFNPWDITGTVGTVGTGASNITASTISNASWNTQEHKIQGNLLTVNMIISDWEMTNKPISPDEIKMKLMNLMVEKMMQDKHIEYTKMLDPVSRDHRFHARIFVVPDTQVRIIRERWLAK